MEEKKFSKKGSRSKFPASRIKKIMQLDEQVGKIQGK